MMTKNGLLLIKPSSVNISSGTATISTNGSVSFSSYAGLLSLNNVFSNDYDNYIIVCRHVPNSNVNGYPSFRLRAAGTDNTTSSSYTRQRLDAFGTTLSSSRDTSSEGTLPNFGFGANGFILNLNGPFLTQPTTTRSNGVSAQGNAYFSDLVVNHNQSTSYDGFTMNVVTGGFFTLSGRIAVYGMRK